jgi:hypothetical protein
MIDFPANPTTGQTFQASNGATWIWDGAKWVSGGAGSPVYLPLSGGTMTGPITLASDPTAALQPATKQYVDATIRYRNRIINGDASIDQRTGFTGVAVTSSTSYVADRWKMVVSVAAQKGTAGAAATTAPGTSGYTNYFYWNTNIAAYAVTTSDYFMFQQMVEGCNFNDAGWGTASAQPVVLEFWAMSTLTGVFGGSLRNNTSNRSYVFSYTITATGVWQKFRINIPGDTAGTWAVAANVVALNLTFSVGAGASLSGAPGSWTSNGFISAPGAVSVVGTLNATLYITGVALMVGAAAANAEPEFRKYSDNLIDCQRYYGRTQLLSQVYQAAGGAVYVAGYLPAMLRAAPTTVTVIGTNNSANISGFALGSLGIPNGVYAYGSATATGSVVISCIVAADADF